MTREEAIQWLKAINTRDFCWDEYAMQESQREIRERCEECIREALNMATEALQTDLVRCKDCKWQKFIDWGMGDCLHPKGSKHIAYDYHYCSYGERKEP